MEWQAKNNSASYDREATSNAMSEWLLVTSNNLARLQRDNDILKRKVKALEDTIDQYRETVTDSLKVIRREKRAVTKVKSDIELVKQDIQSMQSDIKNTRDKTLEPLAVFVGLFTFVSVGFNIFANIKEQTLWISLLLIIAGMVVIFSSLIIHAGSLATKENNRRTWTALLIALGLFILTLGVVIHLCQLYIYPGS